MLASGQMATTPYAAWTAQLELGFSQRGDQTVLSHRKRKGPLSVQRPFYPEGDTCHVYILHPPGGVVGGDELTIQVDVAADAHALITTPGATKFYRSNGATAQQRIHLNVKGMLEWLPQDNIVFRGAQIKLETHIDLGENARFIGTEIHCFGRPANDEPFDLGEASIHLKLSQNGKPLQIEHTRISANAGLHGPACMRHYPVTGIAYASPITAEQMTQIQQSVEASQPGNYFALTLIGNVLVARFLGNTTKLAQQRYNALWKTLRPMVMQCTACVPRIWNT